MLFVNPGGCFQGSGGGPAHPEAPLFSTRDLCQPRYALPLVECWFCLTLLSRPWKSLPRHSPARKPAVVPYRLHCLPGPAPSSFCVHPALEELAIPTHLPALYQLGHTHVLGRTPALLHSSGARGAAPVLLHQRRLLCLQLPYETFQMLQL